MYILSIHLFFIVFPFNLMIILILFAIFLLY